MSIALSLINNLRNRPGYISSSFFFMTVLGYTLYQGPNLVDPVNRYIVAGTAATLTSEVIMHAVDTINMRAKHVKMKEKFEIMKLIRHEGWFSLYRGIQPVLIGYFLSSIVYFKFYSAIKLKLLSFL